MIHGYSYARLQQKQYQECERGLEKKKKKKEKKGELYEIYTFNR